MILLRQFEFLDGEVFQINEKSSVNTGMWALFRIIPVHNACHVVFDFPQRANGSLHDSKNPVQTWNFKQVQSDTMTDGARRISDHVDFHMIVLCTRRPQVTYEPSRVSQ